MTPSRLTTVGKLNLASRLHGLHDDVLVDQDHAAAFLGLEPETLNTWRCTGRYAIPYRKVGRSVRYRLGDLRVWLEGRTHTEPDQ